MRMCQALHTVGRRGGRIVHREPKTLRRALQLCTDARSHLWVHACGGRGTPCVLAAKLHAMGSTVLTLQAWLASIAWVVTSA